MVLTSPALCVCKHPPIYNHFNQYMWNLGVSGILGRVFVNELWWLWRINNWVFEVYLHSVVELDSCVVL